MYESLFHTQKYSNKNKAAAQILHSNKRKQIPIKQKNKQSTAHIVLLSVISKTHKYRYLNYVL